MSGRARGPAVDPLVLGLDQRPRADKAHVALEDVPELGQLVQAREAKEAPDAGDARVVVELSQSGSVLWASSSSFAARRPTVIVLNFTRRKAPTAPDPTLA